MSDTVSATQFWTLGDVRMNFLAPEGGSPQPEVGSSHIAGGANSTYSSPSSDREFRHLGGRFPVAWPRCRRPYPTDGFSLCGRGGRQRSTGCHRWCPALNLTGACLRPPWPRPACPVTRSSSCVRPGRRLEQAPPAPCGHPVAGATPVGGRPQAHRAYRCLNCSPGRPLDRSGLSPAGAAVRIVCARVPSALVPPAAAPGEVLSPSSAATTSVPPAMAAT